MRIVVLVKQVPCSVRGLEFNPDNTLRRAGVRSQLNDADACAVELAWRLAVPRTGTQVTAVTMGPPEAIAGLRTALVHGADEGVHVLDEALHGSDALCTSRVLAATVRRLGFDLVLCGCAAGGSATSAVPAMVAERLGVPALCFADSLCLQGDRVEVRRDDGTAVQTLAATLPAVVSVTPRCARPRVPRFAAVAHARHKLVRTWPLSRLGIKPGEVGLAAAATRVHTVTPAARDGVVFSGDAPAAAARLADFLARRELI